MWLVRADLLGGGGAEGAQRARAWGADSAVLARLFWGALTASKLAPRVQPGKPRPLTTLHALALLLYALATLHSLTLLLHALTLLHSFTLLLLALRMPPTTSSSLGTPSSLQASCSATRRAWSATWRRRPRSTRRPRGLQCGARATAAATGAVAQAVAKAEMEAQAEAQAV